MPTYSLQKGSVQWKFANSRAKVQIFGGAYANGKTTAISVKALRLASEYPGSIGLAARATYPKLNDTLRKVILKWCPPKWVKRYPTQDDNTVYLHNKSEIHFRYIAQRGKNQADGSTTSNLLSATYDYIVVDQIEDPEIQHKDFLDLAGRLRGDASYRPPGDTEDPTMPSTGPRWMMLALNPTRNWVYKELIHPYHMWDKHKIHLPELLIDEETGKPVLELYESDIYANKANLAPDAIALLESLYKGQMRERFLLGKWAAFEGLVYPEFDPEHNVLSREQILEHLDDCLARHVKVRVVEGYDFGLVNPSCYILGFVDDYSRLFILDGYYQSDFKFDRQPNAIREVRERYAGRLHASEPINADPSIFRKQVVAGTLSAMVDTVAKLYQREGIQMRPAVNDITSGVAKMGAYIAGVPHVPSLIEGATNGTLMYVAREMDWWHDEIGAYYWKKNPLGQMLDEPSGGNDHAMDATKYMLSKLPDPSKIVIPKDKLPPQWSYWHELEQGSASTLRQVLRRV